MKRVIILLSLGILFTACKEKSNETIAPEEVQQPASLNEDPRVDPSLVQETKEWSAEEKANAPQLKFDANALNFGEMEVGSTAKKTMKLTNTGKSPLIISNATAFCGCTVPEWPKDPIAPGETAEMVIEFTAKAPGENKKKVTVTANTLDNNHFFDVTARGIGK